MKIKSVLYLILLIPFCNSCEKEFITNNDQIETELEAWEPFIISPVPDTQLGLYAEFSVQIKTVNYTTTYTESEENVWGKETYSNSTTVSFLAVIDSIYLTDYKSNALPSLVSDSARVKYTVVPVTSFGVNTSVNLVVDYHFTSSAEEAGGLTNQPKTRTYAYTTTVSDTLTQDIVYCEYPLSRQYNFLQDEYDYGYIKTYVRPDFLLDKNLVVTITGISTDENYASDMAYDEALGILKYPMPELQNNTIYRIDFIMEKNGILHKFYRSNYFKTSKYNTFSEKISNILEGEHRVSLWEIYPLVRSMTAGDYVVAGGEPLDLYEQVLPSDIIHYEDFSAYEYPKLVTVQLDTTRVDLDRYGYHLASSLGYTARRPADYIGYKPVNDILYFVNYNSDNYSSDTEIRLSDDEIHSGIPVDYTITGYILTSYLAAIVCDDLAGFQGKAANDFERKDDPRVTALIQLDFDYYSMYHSKYYYFLRYRLPGIDRVTFENQYEFGPSL